MGGRVDVPGPGRAVWKCRHTARALSFIEGVTCGVSARCMGTGEEPTFWLRS